MSTCTCEGPITMVRLGLTFVAAFLLVVLCTIGTVCDGLSVPDQGKYNRVERGLAAAAAAAPGAATPSPEEKYRPPIVEMTYGGGPVLWQPIHLYFVWYGTWTAAEKSLIRTVSESLTPPTTIQEYPNLSSYWSVVTSYYQELPNEPRKHTTNNVTIAGEFDDLYSLGQGTSINMSYDPIKILRYHVNQGNLPHDLGQGVYFLFTSADVGFTETPSQCGYHDSKCFDNATDCSNSVNHMVYSYVPGKVPGCNVFGNTSLKGAPPNHVDLDSMIVTYLHELLELAVNPYWYIDPAWRVNQSDIQTEASDMCAYTWVAGDWYYCNFLGIYYDFNPYWRCSSLRVHHEALTEPTSMATFNVYGNGGSSFLVQQFWSLGSKGCVLQMEEAACPKTAVMLTDLNGTIHRGEFFDGVGLQRYAAGGQACTWNIAVPNAVTINLYFDTVALGYDPLADYVTVSDGSSTVVQTLEGFASGIQVVVAGNTAVIAFVSDGSRSPTPSSAGFIMRYEAGF